MPESMRLPKSADHRDMKQVHHEMTQALGKGPMRFGAVRRPLNVKDRLVKNEEVLAAFIELEVAVAGHGIDESFGADHLYRAALYHNFDIEKSVKLLKRMDPRHWNISIAQLETQLETQTLYPLPRKLRSKDKDIDCFFYMKPSRFVPNQTKTSTIIANLLYVMDSMDHYSDKSGSKKIGFIANMNDWTMEHFAVDYCLQFMESLQGRKGPINVDMFLIVNPPGWFGKVWKIMKPMLSPNFKRKVHMIPEAKLGDFLAPGYTKYLPQEFARGEVDAGELVQDFIRYRTYVETKVYPSERIPNKATAELVRPKTSSAKEKRRPSMAVVSVP